MSMLNPIAQLGEASGGGATVPDYAGTLVAISEYAGGGFGDGLTHYDADEEATYSGGVLTLQQGSMVAITIPADVRADVAGFFMGCEYGAIRPDSNDYLVAWLQKSAGTAALDGPGLLTSYLHRGPTVVSGSAAVPSLSVSSTSSSHGASPAAGASFTIGLDLSPRSTAVADIIPLYSAAGATGPGLSSSIVADGWRVGDGAPAPERVVVWLRDTVGPTPGATVKIKTLQILRKRGIWL